MFLNVFERGFAFLVLVVFVVLVVFFCFFCFFLFFFCDPLGLLYCCCGWSGNLGGERRDG